MSPTFLGETRNARGVGEVSGDEVGATALQLDFFDRLDTAPRVAAMHGDLGAIPRELKGDRAAEAGRRSRDEGLQAVEIVLLSRHRPLLFADFSLREGVERFLRDSARLVSYCFGLCPGDQRKG
jgi:hypothetical protein